MISHNEIKLILKQKTPFLFVDKVIVHERGKRIVSLKNVTGNEFFAAFHFPNNPVYPGIFVIESIAQTTAILCSLATDDEHKGDNMQFWALGGLQRFNFLKPIRPGDTMKNEVEIVKMCSHMALVKAKVKVEEEIVADGQLTFGVIRNE